MMGDKEFQTHYYVFRLVRGSGKEGVVLYALESNPLDSANGCVSYSDLPSLAAAFVEHQLNELRRIGLSGDEHFAFSFTFQPPFDVKMQRDSFWQARPLTAKEQKEFLDHVKKHYLEQCDPEGYKNEFPEDCEII